MEAMNVSDSGKRWTSRANAVSRRINLGWWWQSSSIVLAALLLVLGLAILCFRTIGSADLEAGMALFAVVTMMFVAGVLGWIFSRRKFVDVGDGFVRLEERLRMKNRLTVAAAGIGTWPEFQKVDFSRLGLRWNWSMTLLPTFLALIVVSAAVVIPIPEKEMGDEFAVNEPGPWGQMEDWLATLEEEEVIDEASLDEFEEKIEELRNQPEEEWYSHASMEATDTLKDGLGREIRDIAAAMEMLERDLGLLKEFSAELSEESRERLLQEFQDALDQLGNSGLEMSQSLREKLAGIDPAKLSQSTLSQMTDAELEALRQQLGEASESLGSMEGLPSIESGQMLALVPGQQPGQGAVQRGRGDAPLFFGDKNDLGTENLEEVKNQDLSRAALGELVGVGETEREIDETPAGPIAGGGVFSTGVGGEAVWRDEALLPDEKALLKRYFK